MIITTIVICIPHVCLYIGVISICCTFFKDVQNVIRSYTSYTNDRNYFPSIHLKLIQNWNIFIRRTILWSGRCSPIAYIHTWWLLWLSCQPIGITINLKGILWDRRWIVPSIGIFSHTCWSFYRNAFLIMKLSKLILHKFCSVLTCDILCEDHKKIT